MAQDYLTVPKEYLRPKAYEDEASRYNFENDRFKPDRRNKENWYIITVNPDSYFYTEPDTDSEKIREIPFRHAYFVLKNRKEWLLLANKNGTELGWIQKKDALQWKRGLLDPVTGINLKGFILNKAKDLSLIHI